MPDQNTNEPIQPKKKPLLVVSKVPVVEKVFFAQNLALMIKSGFSIGDALEVLREQAKSKLFKKQIADIKAHVVQGSSFSSALANHPDTFDELFVAMIEAGEISGSLETTLRQLTEHMKKSYALKRKVRGAMMYPVLITVLMFVMGAFVFVYVLPNILSLYEGNDYALPGPTQFVLNVNDFVRDNFIILGVVIAIIGAGFVLTWRNESGRYGLTQILIRLPIMGKILKDITIANISRILYSLIVTDIPIVRSYQMIAKAIGNRVYRSYLLLASEQLSKGNSIFSTIEARPNLFPPVVAQMIRVGEDTGTLDEMMNEIAKFYEEEVDNTMSNITSLIEPVLMITIGFGVAFLAVAILLPIYGLVDQI